MANIAKRASVSMLFVAILFGAGYVTGQQDTQTKPVPAVKPKAPSAGYHEVPPPTNSEAAHLDEISAQLKELQVSLESLRSEQQLMKVGLESAVRLATQNGLDLSEITHNLAENGKTLDGVARQLQVLNRGVDLAASGVGMLIDRTTTLPTDMRQIKARLGAN